MAARERALRLLGIRARGREELRRELLRRGFAAQAARLALDRLEREGWLEDLAAARAVVRARGSRYGRARLERELSSRGFSQDTVRRALQERPGGEEAASLSRAFARLWKGSAGLPLRRRRERVTRALLRRGFAPEAISDIMKGSDEVDGGSGEVP